MKPTGENVSMPSRLTRKLLWLAPLLGMFCVLVTGCPHNDYTVELKPKAGAMERTLTFYRADGTDANGGPNYQTFPSNELAAITRVYPAGAVKPEGQRYVARADFAVAMPHDVGGAGSYTNLATSLGDAGFYLERFRGDDDLVAKTARQYHAADQLADLVIGWTQTEFGHEPGWQNLHGFLDGDFRKDLKNAGRYFQLGLTVSLSNTNAPEEFMARYGQYLIERGYLKPAGAPELYLIINGDDAAILRWIRRLTAEKMGLKTSDPLPKSFAVLADPAAFQKSWENYLAQGDLYRTKLKAWEEKSKLDPNLAAPKPLDAPNDLIQELLGWSLDGEDDQLTVKLALPHAPHRTNGKWSDGQVEWTVNLGDFRNTLPAICYAGWSNPNDAFQSAHFGAVILADEELSEYCLWQNGLTGSQSAEWESFLNRLQPGEKLAKNLKNFRFTTASGPNTTAGDQDHLADGCKMIVEALAKK